MRAMTVRTKKRMSVICYIGYATVAILCVKALIFLYQTIFFKSSSIKKYLNKNKWAVVTGATAGIGEGFTYELVKRGVNVLAVSRSQTKLDELVNNARKKYPKSDVLIETLVIDFAHEIPEQYCPKLQKAIEGKAVSVLVNNVGVNNKDNKPFYFLEQDNNDLKTLIDVNINATIYVTKTVLPSIEENGGGVVYNLSSYGARFPIPMNAVYSGTKSFIDAWSQALDTEYASKNIRVLSLLPMYVASNMTKIRKTSLMVINGQKLANDALNAFNAPFLSSSFSPYIVHRLIMSIFSILPEKFISKQALNNMKLVRKKMDRKREEPKKSQ
jgi:17beta-estradiol 17-dehydrogenase / very-long-chain 3-oxoacyl-CoA reductase